MPSEHGVDAIVVSNHGGRQLDRTPVADRRPPGGRRRGRRASRSGWTAGSGADSTSRSRAPSVRAGVLVGRPILWALAAAVEHGVERALAILREELELALPLLGARTPADLTRDHIA